MNRGGNDNFEIIGKTDGEDIHHGITSKARIIIAEECEKTGCALADSLKKRGFFAATRAADGVALLDVIKNERPDVVIVGLFMKETDAPELIRRSSCFERRPFFIVLSAYRCQNIEDMIMSYGNTYFMLRPYDINLLVKIINVATMPDIYTNERLKAEERLESISLILHKIGIPTHIKGYRYIRDAVMLCADDPKLLEGVTKRLYPMLARRFETTASCVERAIRHAIEKAWERCELHILEMYFGCTIDPERGKPTNRELIAMVTDKVRRRGI